MCGICGAFSTSPLSEHELDKVRKLVVLNHWRGEDSTGAMWWNSPVTAAIDEKPMKKDFGYMKRLEHPFYFEQITWEEDLKKKAWKENRPQAISVHCRAATIGAIKVKNAHPFHSQNIIGMHNGTVSADFRNSKKFETDSEAIINNIAQLGIEDTIQDLPYNAAYALVWMNMKDGTLNFLKNVSRPLHIYNQGSTIYWSSAAHDLEYVFRDSIDGPNTHTTNSSGQTLRKILQFENDQMYTINLEKTGDVTWTRKKVERVYVSQHTGGWKASNGHPFSNQNLLPSSNHLKNTTSGTTAVGNGTTLAKFSPWIFNQIQWPRMLWAAADWKKLGKYILPPVAEQHGQDWFYAAEFDMFFEAQDMVTILLWRICNTSKFQQALQDKWLTATKEQEGFILKNLGLSKNQLKRLLRGRGGEEFFLVPIIIPCNYKKVHYTNIFLPADIEAARSAFLNHGTPKVLPLHAPTSIAAPQQNLLTAQAMKEALNDELPWDDDVDIEASLEDMVDSEQPCGEEDDGTPLFSYGYNHIGTQEEITKMLQKGCCYCSTASTFEELRNIFWCDNEQFLCPSCQKDALDGHIDSTLIPHYQLIPQFVALREERDTENEHWESAKPVVTALLN